MGLSFSLLASGFSSSPLAAPNADLAALSRTSVVQFTGTESISQPFAFDIDFTIAHPALNFANVVRQPLLTTVAPGRTSGDWVRVAQIATGVGTTSIWIPGIGDEVVLAFEHGDPRRPVIIGSMWNGKDLPSSSFPANKFRVMFQGRSISGGINEIVMDDTSGQECLILRSGKQFLTLSPTGITACSTMTTPGIQNLRPSTGLKAPSLPAVPIR